MIKRYSFKSKEQAQELILGLIMSAESIEEIKADEELSLPSASGITITETTSGIRLLGFQDVYEDEVLIKAGTTYDVDILWKSEPNENWIDYEVTPKSPNHNFA